jgi:uncharacterized protein (TIGR03435 family)
MRTSAGILLMILSTAAAQTPQFEVASIKPAPPPDGTHFTRITGGPAWPDPSLFTCENCSLSMLVMRAYGLKDYQFSGPGWAESARFNISAKIAMGTTREQFQQMQRGLLSERFGLTFHHEKKEMAQYDLAVAKNGPKFKESPPATPLAEDGPVAPQPPGQLGIDANGFPTLPGRSSFIMTLANGRATMRSAEESMAEFARRLSEQVGRPVTDATGLKGKYDFTLNWVVEGPGNSTEDPGPTIFKAVQDQLGLRLESKKGLVDILVVDHIEKNPTEN